MKNYVLAAVLLALSACNLFDDGYSLGPSRASTGRTASSDSTDARIMEDTSVYVLGIEYPDDYDWVKDTATGTVQFNVVLFKNGQKVMSLPTGEARSLGGALDCHLFIDGHIYSSFISGSQTVMKKDGVELFSYDGYELLRGIVVDGEDVYTVTQSNSGTGCFYRRNDEEVFNESKGTVLGTIYSASYESGALYEDMDALCFCYGCRVSQYTNTSVWYLVKNGKTSEIELPDGTASIGDVRMVNGRLCMLVSENGGYYLRIGDDEVQLRANGYTPTASSIYNVEGEVYVSGYISKTSRYVLWDSGGNVLASAGAGKTVKEFHFMDGDIAYVANSGSYISEVVHGGTTWGFEGKQVEMYNTASTLFGGRFYVAVSRYDGNYPYLWVDGEVTEIPINGYLRSVHVVVE